MLLSSSSAQGDGVINCDAANEAAALAAVPQGYELRGSVEVRRFDEVMPYEDVKAIKVSGAYSQAESLWLTAIECGRGLLITLLAPLGLPPTLLVFVRRWTWRALSITCSGVARPSSRQKLCGSCCELWFVAH